MTSQLHKVVSEIGIDKIYKKMIYGSYDNRFYTLNYGIHFDYLYGIIPTLIIKTHIPNIDFKTSYDLKRSLYQSSELMVKKVSICDSLLCVNLISPTSIYTTKIISSVFNLINEQLKKYPPNLCVVCCDNQLESIVVCYNGAFTYVDRACYENLIAKVEESKKCTLSNLMLPFLSTVLAMVICMVLLPLANIMPYISFLPISLFPLISLLSKTKLATNKSLILLFLYNTFACITLYFLGNLSHTFLLTSIISSILLTTFSWIYLIKHGIIQKVDLIVV